jgi:hypothetical protein
VKKLINHVDTVLAESLDGFAAAHADIVTLGAERQFVRRRSLKPGKVALISGGETTVTVRGNGKAVQTFLGLKKEDVSRLADVSPKSVRFDGAMPESLRERMQEIAITINLVAKVFEGNADKTIAWFQTRNPLLGDISPRDMIRLGRFERLRKFIMQAMTEEAGPPLASAVH